MGYTLDSCPTLHSCCNCVPLRLAVMIISVIGLWWAALYVFAFTTAGRDAFVSMGVPINVANFMRYIHGIFGVLLCAVHILLFFAAVHKSDCLCELYVWFMAVFWVFLFLFALIIAVSACIAEKMLFAAVFISLIVISVLVSVYFTIVVANYRMTIP